MKKIIVMSILVLTLVGCKSFKDLKDGNTLALENQKNLETNTMRAIDNVKKAGKAYAKASGTEWTKDDEKKWSDQQNELATQLAINRAWLLVIEEAIKQDSLNADLMKSLIKDVPGWVKDGKDIYDLIKSKTKK